MEKLVYPACFYPHKDKPGYLVVVPDLPGCISSGDSLAEALGMAMDAASGWVLDEMEDGKAVPKPSNLENIVADEEPDGFVNLLLVDLETYQDKLAKQERTKKRAEIQKIIDLYVDGIKNICGNDLQQISLFGSYARGDFRADSDINILIVVNEKDYYKDELVDLTFELMNKIDLWIDMVVKDSEDFRKWRNTDFFLLNVAKEEVRLYGDM